jgi:Cft2 family RNA processing exonuclease
LPKLVKWVSHIQGVQKVFLTHGEVNQRQGLREKIKAETEIQEVFLPGDGESFELDG